MKIRLYTLLALVPALSACQPHPDIDAQAASIAVEPQPLPCMPPPIDPTRSLLVTDATVLAQFPLQRVLDQLVARANSGVPQDGLSLYQQWFDTLNDPSHSQTGGPSCTGSINGFPSECPRIEGVLAATNPFQRPAGAPFDDTYHPTALVFRLDLAPADGASCGEARIVYAKANSGGRNFLIFEGAIANPSPSSGLSGCLPIAQYWANQSAISDFTQIARNLAAFYFDGVAATNGQPIVDPKNYGGATAYGQGGKGQIRVNLFMLGRTYFAGSPQPPTTQFWQLREYKTATVCVPSDGSEVMSRSVATTDSEVAPGPIIIEPPPPMPVVCHLELQEVTVKNNPAKSLFADGTANAQFQNDFLAQVPSLAIQDAATLGMNIPDRYNSGESNSDARNDYAGSFNPNGSFAAAIANKLSAIGRSDLRPVDIVERATTQSCGGCHQLSNNRGLGGLTWPSSGNFVHIDEQSRLSTALTNVFLPHRGQVLASFIGNTCSGVSPAPEGATLGGAATN